MQDFIKTLILGLLPPELPLNENGPPSKEDIVEYRKSKRRWYKVVALSLWTLLIGGTVFITWSMGAFSRFPGFAYAEDVHADVEGVSQKVSAVENLLSQLVNVQLEAQLLENRRQQCSAIKDDDAARKHTYATIMQELKDKHLKAHGVAWDEPDCEAL